ncbi:MAG: hypothetical protein IIB78_07905 [Proteobacteria bacterium]|nr:hypothetical protein [Pseudomonadota bacterium]MCH8057777.1 hypothetical protein [Pseudomonadota bacterium]
MREGFGLAARVSVINLKKILFVVLVLLAGMAYRDWSLREIEYPPGVLVSELPKQVNVRGLASVTMDGYELTPRAEFEIRARVLARKDYNWGTEADLSPVDLALGWGVMSDQAVLDRIEISQGSRWYYTRYELPAPISEKEIIQNSGNMHMVPAQNRIRKKLQDVRVGDIVRLRGRLVDIDHPSGWHWRTSLSRDDTGSGSCEIVYLEDIEIEAR